ncbi:MAG: ABC transporter permease [Proteobacteria bacterium]|jgi:ribose/xylose/arabinose/galactoside ABC-type transport system permease subunit|nr:MAG: ABC transporter permease [Pseudomonadota bacterium]|tara:strand:- start:155 stop:1129 length:975 start_codon:yes stop_codon:yes gene_type:complete
MQHLFKYFIWYVLIATFLCFSLLIPNFSSPTNVQNILIGGSVLGIMVIGQALCLFAKNLDLSAEGNVSIVTVIAAWLMLPAAESTFAQAGGLGVELAPVLVVPIMLTLGTFFGFINGLLIAYVGMNFFIVTLAMQLVLRGFGYVISEGAVMPGTPSSFNFLGGGQIYGIPMPIITTIIVFLIFHFFIKQTTIGRQVLFVGSNIKTAQTVGIDQKRIVLFVYAVSGFLAAFAGWMLLGKLETSVPNLGAELTLNVVAAAVIGGVSLKGGEGSLIGALAGVLLLAIINNALNLMNVDPYWVNAVRGFIILLALIIDAQKQRFLSRI